MTVVPEMLGAPTPGFEWVYPPRTRCWRLLCRGVSDGFFLALLLAPQFFRNSISDFLKAPTAWIAFLGFLGFLGLGLPSWACEYRGFHDILLSCALPPRVPISVH